MHDTRGGQPLVDRLVGRPQPPGMLHGDDTAACDRARESDNSIACAEHRLADDCSQVDATVPGRPLAMGLLE